MALGERLLHLLLGEPAFQQGRTSRSIRSTGRLASAASSSAQKDLGTSRIVLMEASAARERRPLTGADPNEYSKPDG